MPLVIIHRNSTRLEGRDLHIFRVVTQWIAVNREPVIRGKVQVVHQPFQVRDLIPRQPHIIEFLQSLEGATLVM